jgi:glutathione S-transferase
MQVLGIPYEHLAYTAWSQLAEVREVNPVGRVPALVLDSGDSLFDSTAILDYLDQQVGPQRALVPPSGAHRQRVLQITACALGVLEKVVAALYERTMHPPEKVHEPWVAHSESQAHSGLRWLDAIVPSPWLAGKAMTQADITTIVTYEFTRIVNEPLLADGRYPTLDSLAATLAEHPAFVATRPTGEVDQANPSLPAVPC